jgi:hypothetical protein
MIQTLFPNNAGAGQSWFEEHEGELQYLGQHNHQI